MTVVGRVEDLGSEHGSLVAHLSESDGTVWICEIEGGLVRRMGAAWRQMVRVTGTLTIVAGERRFRVEDIDILSAPETEEPPLSGPALAEAIARRQGIRPIADAKELEDRWPKELESEGLLEFIMSERRARRKAMRDLP